MSQKELNDSVPILITWDVDPDLWMPFEKRQWALNTAMDLCHQIGIRATFFFTAQPADAYLVEFQKMYEQGHEIGCHGFTHGHEEDYDKMSEELQNAYIGEATEKLRTLVDAPIRSFRSPRVKTSAYTLKLLAEYGYLVDSSVCSQRMDVVSSNLINTSWIFAPRRPYRPCNKNAFKHGTLPIWEVPVSAMILPFISSSLKVLGLSAMKFFFKLLYAEAKRTGKPIVYLAHPTEFVGGKTKRTRRWNVHAKHEYFTLSYIRTHGLRLRTLFYRIDSETLLSYTRALFDYMASFSGVEFMTIGEYAASHLGEVSQQDY